MTTPTDLIVTRAADGAERPPTQIPSTCLGAQAAIPFFEQRCIDTYKAAERARRDWERARGDLAVVRATADGEFEPDGPTHATGSCGSWPLA